MEGIANPESLSRKEKRIFEKTKKKTHMLLDDLKSKDLIRRPMGNLNGGTPNFIKILQNLEEHKRITNIFTELCNQEKVKQFIIENKKFGFNDKNIPYLYVFLMIFQFNRETESMKLALMSILRKLPERSGYKSTLGQIRVFLNKKSCYAASLFNDLQCELRNSFSHNLFWFEKGKIFYCNDASLIKSKQIKLEEFLSVAKEQNILTNAILTAIAEKTRIGFFDALM